MTIIETQTDSVQVPFERLDPHKPPAINIVDMLNIPYTDTTGVPISSDRISDVASIAHIDFDYQACPFHDSPSRYPDGHPHSQPMSGLERRRLRGHYQAVLSIMSTVRSAYLASPKSAEGTTPEGHLNPKGLRSVLRALHFLPIYLANRAQNPVSARNTMPPAVIIGANSASGSLGAIEGYVNTYGVSADAPDVDKVIETMESIGSMVGKKTVCVASPSQMRHYIRSVITGVGVSSDNDEFASLLHPDEAEQLFAFSHAAYEAVVKISEFVRLDKQTEEDIIRAYQNGQSPQIYVDMYLGVADLFIENLYRRQDKINRALGRNEGRPVLTLATLERYSYGIVVPAFLRKVLEKQS